MTVVTTSMTAGNVFAFATVGLFAVWTKRKYDESKITAARIEKIAEECFAKGKGFGEAEERAWDEYRSIWPPFRTWESFYTVLDLGHAEIFGKRPSRGTLFEIARDGEIR